jgi:hypothetical protein
MLTRRGFFLLAPAAAMAAFAMATGKSAHARAVTPVAVPNAAIGAIVAAAGGELVRVGIDGSLAAGQIRIGDGAAVEIARKLRLKGKGQARDRFLDDARNATRVGSAVRDALSQSLPAHAKTFDANHTAWARPFARKALAWSRQLAASKVAGAKVRDEHGRVYLLEWAGAQLDPRGQRAPAGLANAPKAPDHATLASYERYLDALVAALV